MAGRDSVRTALSHWLDQHAARASARYGVFAVGKAAREMWQGAHDLLGERIASGIVVAKDVAESCRGDPAFARAQVYDAAHPLPDERSLAAGHALLQAVGSLPADCFPILLISGGASSLAEVPRAGVTLEQLRAESARGLAGGVPIGELNRRRATLSALKAGGLTRQLGGRAALALFISDVPGDDPAVIGSGLLAPLPGEPPGDHVERRVIATIEHALAAVEQAAREAGLVVRRQAERLTGEAAGQGADLAKTLLDGPPGVFVAGGETTVTLPPEPGHGGRNQHLALAAARALAGQQGVWLLAAGTDGIDGATGDAGALVGGQTWQAALDAGLDPAAGLAAADAGTVLEATGDVVHTGPTGTNVGDLVIGLKVSGVEGPDVRPPNGHPADRMM